MNKKLEKMQLEIDKLKKKRDKVDTKIHELEAQYEEEEKNMIHDMMQAANLTPSELAELIELTKTTAPSPSQLESVKQDKGEAVYEEA